MSQPLAISLNKDNFRFQWKKKFFSFTHSEKCFKNTYLITCLNFDSIFKTSISGQAIFTSKEKVNSKNNILCLYITAF